MTASLPAPPISVVLPVYNAAPFVAQAIASIRGQTFADFEVLIVDDGSTDGSLHVMQEAIAGDPRCRVASRANKGIVATLNEAIDEARGEFVFRMDADDVCLPDRFARQMAYLHANPGCVALGTRVMLTDDTLLPIIEGFTNTSHAKIDAENMSGLGSAICHPSVAMRRSVLQAAGGYRAEFELAEDLDLFLRLAEHGQLASLPEVLMFYRQHLGSLGHSRRALQRTRAAAAVRAATRRRWAHGAGLAQLGAGADPQGEASPPLASEYGSKADVHRKWAWLSLIGGHPATARKHALRAVTLEPLRPANLRLVACAIRGR